MTAQNTLGVTDPGAVAGDGEGPDRRGHIRHPPRATKIGMLAKAAIVECVAEAIRRLGCPTSCSIQSWWRAARLLDEDAIAAIVNQSAPARHRCDTKRSRSRGSDRWNQLAFSICIAPRCGSWTSGAQAAMVKGGHLDGPAIDVLFSGGKTLDLSSKRITAAILTEPGARFRGHRGPAGHGR